jgi:hypothetical protein
MFTINQPPLNGFCDIDQTIGYGMVTNFVINCSNWQDSEGISNYLLIGN